jgi:hypothetical protein
MAAMDTYGGEPMAWLCQCFETMAAMDTPAAVETWTYMVLRRHEEMPRHHRLNHIVRNPTGSRKKYHVYVKKGDREVKVQFGDPNMRIMKQASAACPAPTLPL